MFIGPVTLTSTLLAVLLSQSGGEPWRPGHRFRDARIQLPLPAAARPLTLPADHFGIRFDGRLLRTEDHNWRGPLEAGAGYGVTDHIEVGLRLLRLTLVEAGDREGGLQSPAVYGAGRLVFGPAEIGGLAEVELPFSGFQAADVGGFFRLHGGRWSRLDLGARLGGRFDSPARATLTAPLEGLLSLGPRLAVGGGVAIESDDLFGITDLRLRPQGRLVVTLGDRQGVPLLDLEARFLGPAAQLRASPEALEFSAGLSVVLFFDDLSDDPGFESDPW